MMSVVWDVELEPEVEEWLSGLAIAAFAAAAFHLDRLAGQGPALRMPHSRALGEGLFELRFYLNRTAERITYFFPGEQRIVLLTEFHKQKMNERTEIERARVPWPDASEKATQPRRTTNDTNDVEGVQRGSSPSHEPERSGGVRPSLRGGKAGGRRG
jgi:hypothetical protein